MANMQRHGTLAYIESTITGNLDKQQQSMATKQAPVIWREDGKQSSSTSAQKRQSKHQYLSQKRQTKNQYLAQFAFIQILLPVAYYHSFYCLLSSNENLGIKHVSCGLKRLKKFLPSSRHLSLTFVFHFTLFTLHLRTRFYS